MERISQMRGSARGTKWPEGFDPLTIGAHGPGVDYSNTEFTVSAYHLDLKGANFTGAQIGGRRDFAGAKLINANLQDANFSNVSLVIADLTGANLDGTDFTDARFSSGTKWPEGFDPLTIGAHGPGVDYSNTEFTVSAYHLDLKGANFTGARIGGRRDFAGAKLINANLQDANFSNVSLVIADLTGANLDGTDFTDARFSSGTKWPEGFDPLTIGAHGPGVDYSNTEFTVSAYHLDLKGANFTGARIGGRRDFAGAKLINANLQDANFSNANLVIADLTGANLDGTDFTDARFSSGTKWPEGFDPLTIGAHGPGVDYSNTEFTVSAYHLDLKGANFTGARIGGRRNFVGSNLTGANLENANFSKASLQNARLNGANLKGADFTKIKYNSNTDWTGAIYSVHTKWPEGFDPQAAGAVLEWQSPKENPDGTGLVHYKEEYEKAQVLLAELKKQVELSRKKLNEKESKILNLDKKIEQENTALLSVKTDLAKAEAGHRELLNELNEANQTLVVRSEKVRRLKNELAQSVAMESSLRLEVESESYKLEESKAKYTQMEARSGIPHIKGWHYTPTQGWLFTEPGTYPLVFAEQSQSWMYYDQGTSQPWWYFNYNSQAWVDWKAE